MTKKILVTGGTVFVSKFVATYFKNHDYDAVSYTHLTLPTKA